MARHIQSPHERLYIASVCGDWYGGTGSREAATCVACIGIWDRQYGGSKR